MDGDTVDDAAGAEGRCAPPLGSVPWAAFVVVPDPGSPEDKIE